MLILHMILWISKQNYPLNILRELSRNCAYPFLPQVDHPIVELDLNNGVMEATSEFRKESSAQHAIKKDPKSHWASQAKPATSPFVALIWFKFTSDPHVIPSKISFKPLQAELGDDRFGDAHDWMPSKWQFVGSNDDVCKPDGNWRVLCEDQSGQKIVESIWKAGMEIRSCEVVWKMFTFVPKAFRCLGIRVIDSNKYYRDNKQYAALHRMRIWGQVEN